MFYSYNNLWFIFAKKLDLGRLVALDYGLRRTGIAVTDEMQIIASGLTTVETPKLLAFLKDYFSKNDIDAVVIGEPKQMNNTPSESEALIQPFLKKFTIAFPTIKIEREDERFTSKMAFQTMIDSGLGKQKRKNKALVDEISATLILQSYMNRI